MFCYKCGKEIPDDASFCSACGTRIGGTEKEGLLKQLGIEKPQITLPDMENIKRGANVLKDSKIYFIATLAGILLALLLLGGEMFEVTFEFLSTRVERFTMFEDRGFLKFLFVVGFLLSAALMLVPFATGKAWKEWNMYPAVAVSAVAVIALFVIMISVKEQMSDSWLMEAVEAKASLTAGGWCFLLANIVVVVCTMKSAFSIGEIQEKAVDHSDEAQAAIEDSQPPYWCYNCGEEGPFEGDACPKCGMKSKRYFDI